MITFYLYQDLVETKDWNLIPKESAWWLNPLTISLWSFTIKEWKLIILKSKNEMISNIINAMFTWLKNL